MAIPLIPLMATPPGMVLGALAVGVAVGEAITGEQVKSFNPLSADFGKTTQMSAMTRVQNLGEAGLELVPGLGKSLHASISARKVNAVNRLEQVSDKRRSFVYVEGQRTVDADPLETEIFLRSVKKKKETAVIKGDKTSTKHGDKTSVPYLAGPDFLGGLHTHPTSGVALFSPGDIDLFNQLRYVVSPEGVHSVLGWKYPQTRKLLLGEGLAPPTEVVATRLKQRMVPKTFKPRKLSRWGYCDE
jgi:hypothetical protein